MANFKEKAIWVWNDYTMGTPAQVAAKLKAANFEAAYLHSTNVGNWRTNSRIALVNALRAVGIAVYGSVAVYAQVYTAAEEGRRAAAIVNEYNLEGMVFDVETGNYESTTTGAQHVRELFLAYKAATLKPSAFCGWALYEGYHPVAVLQEAMKYADVGMPMAYWYNGVSPSAAVSTLNGAWTQWRKYTTKPIIPGGRAYTDSYVRAGVTITITARGDAVTAFDARARQLGAPGITWWDMEHGIKIADVWAALTATPKMGTGTPPVPEVPEDNVNKDKALLYYALSKADPGWNNPVFAGYVARGVKLNGEDDPAQDLRDMEDKARALGKHFIINMDFTMAYYTGMQYPMERAKWPSLAMDYPLQQFISIASSRNADEIWITFMDPNDHTGKPGSAAWLDFTLMMFLEKAVEWKKANKPNLRLRVITSWEFMNTFVTGRLNWLGNYQTGIYQKHRLPLDASYPQESDVPGDLGAIAGWEFWRYYDYGSGQALILFNGDAAKLAVELGKPPVDPPPHNDDDDTGGGGTTNDPRVDSILITVAALQAGANAMQAKLNSLEMELTLVKQGLAHTHKSVSTTTTTVGPAE